MKAGEISNHPISVPLLPIKRGAPLLLIYFFPTRRMPPAKSFVASGIHEFQVLSVAHRRAIDPKIFKEDLVLRFLVVERERRKRRRLSECPHRTGVGAITKREQAALDFSHARYCFNRFPRRSDRRVKLIAKQMLDVVNQ